MKRVLIIGSSGGFGELLARRFAGDGFVLSGIDLVPRALGNNEHLSHFLAADITTLNDEARRLVRESDWIMLAIPEAQAVASLPALMKAARPGALLADILSVKTRIVETAKRSDACEYVSIHPLFGPQQGNFEGNVTVVPVRAGPEAPQLVQTLRRWGGRVSEMSADEHDRMMAIVQVITHAAILCFGATTSAANIDPDSLSKSSTPVHAGLAALVARVTAGDPSLYWDIQKNNPHAAAARDELARRIEQFRSIIDRGDFGAFAALYDQARSAFAHLQPTG